MDRLEFRVKNLAVIPARSGSKRIPKKNIRLLNKKPVIAYTIEEAKLSCLFDRVIVSTDSQEIADIALEYGAEVPFIRDISLADDHTPVSAVTLNVLEWLERNGEFYHHVAQLLPNCPLRTAKSIQESYKQFVQSDTNAQLSVSKYGWFNPWWAFVMDGTNKLNPAFPEKMDSRSQDLSELYCPTGSIWWIKSDILKEEGTFHVSDKTGWEISLIESVDIDNEDEWQLAEQLMIARLHAN